MPGCKLKAGKMKYTNWTYFLITLAAITVLSCGDKADPVAVVPPDDNTPGDGNAVTVSYTSDVKPVLELYCTGCHSSQLSGAARNGAPLSVNLDTYEASAANAERANLRIQSGSMPPGGSVPDADKAVFQLWVSEGAPR